MTKDQRKDQRKAIDEGIEKLGGFVKAAAHFKVTPAALSNWRKRGVSLKRLKEFVSTTGVPRERLRPDLYA